MALSWPHFDPKSTPLTLSGPSLTNFRPFLTILWHFQFLAIGCAAIFFWFYLFRFEDYQTTIREPIRMYVHTHTHTHTHTRKLYVGPNCIDRAFNGIDWYQTHSMGHRLMYYWPTYPWPIFSSALWSLGYAVREVGVGGRGNMRSHVSTCTIQKIELASKAF